MKINFKGYVGKDAELRKVMIDKTETSVCDVWVAENIGRGETKKTEWHKVTLWRGYAEKMAPWLTKGRRVEVTGAGTAKAYTTKAGQIVPYIQVSVANGEVEFLDLPDKQDKAPEPEAEVETVPVSEDELPY